MNKSSAQSHYHLIHIFELDPPIWTCLQFHPWFMAFPCIGFPTCKCPRHLHNLTPDLIFSQTTKKRCRRPIGARYITSKISFWNHSQVWLYWFSPFDLQQYSLNISPQCYRYFELSSSWTKPLNMKLTFECICLQASLSICSISRSCQYVTIFVDWGQSLGSMIK